jgi:hypothetical protein
MEHVMTHAISERATSRKSLIRFTVAVLATGLAGAASAQGSAGAVPQVYGSAWVASQQAMQAANTRATAPSGAGNEIRVSSRLNGANNASPAVQ